MDSCRYHPIYGARIFDGDSLPQARYGWFDTPTAAAKAKENLTALMQRPEEDTIVPVPKTKDQIRKMTLRSEDPEWPDPMNFKNADEYLAEYRSWIHPSVNGAQVDLKCRKALDHFAAVRYTTRLAGRRNSSIDMLHRARQIERSGRAIPAREFPDLE